MIETPAAAWRTDVIAPKVDFLSVGGNDLAQFYFAADRDSERMERRFDGMNPGFLKFLKMVVDKAANRMHTARTATCFIFVNPVLRKC